MLTEDDANMYNDNGVAEHERIPLSRHPLDAVANATIKRGWAARPDSEVSDSAYKGIPTDEEEKAFSASCESEHGSLADEGQSSSKCSGAGGTDAEGSEWDTIANITNSDSENDEHVDDYTSGFEQDCSESGDEVDEVEQAVARPAISDQQPDSDDGSGSLIGRWLRNVEPVALTDEDLMQACLVVVDVEEKDEDGDQIMVDAENI